MTDNFDVVRDSLSAYSAVDMLQGSELVAVRLSWLVLEGIRVDGVEGNAEFSGLVADGCMVLRDVPGDV